MSTLLFVEILRERDVHTTGSTCAVMRTSESFGRAEPDVAGVCGTGRAAVAPAPERNVGHYQGFIGSEAKAAPRH